MTDKKTETPAESLFGDASDGSIMVSVGEFFKPRPGAKAKPQPDERRKPKAKKPDG